MGYTNNKSLTSLGSEQSRTNPLPSPWWQEEEEETPDLREVKLQH
jgi:hypothetical protein